MFRRSFSLAFLCYCAFVTVLPAEEWYLISETELRSIEQYKLTWEANKQTWLTQVQQLKSRAESLRQESENLNQQLAAEREIAKNLMLSFEKLEQDRLLQLSSHYGEITELKQQVETHKRKADKRLVIMVCLGAAITGYIALRVVRLLMSLL